MKIKFTKFIAMMLILSVFAGQSGAAAAVPEQARAFYFPAELRIGLLSDFYNRPFVAVNNPEIIYTTAYGRTGRIFSAAGFFVSALEQGGIGIFDVGIDGAFRTFAASPVIRGAYDAPVSLDGRLFRGGVEFIPASSGITAVNIVSMEEYLFSVVPAEMPALWSAHALKAQAVAARTYAVNNIEGNHHTGFHLCDRTCCQVYAGMSSEHPNSTAAVMATAGRILLYNGLPISAVYFASSGGFTENSENVWQSPLPYLRAVPDPFEHETPEWTRAFSFAELTPFAEVGQVINVAVGGHTPAGRVSSLRIYGTNGVRVLEREEIRRFFTPAGGMLPSRVFNLLSGAGGVIITGRGAGHGVGMSQRGAEGMARRGATYSEILLHYYRGAVLSEPFN